MSALIHTQNKIEATEQFLAGLDNLNVTQLAQLYVLLFRMGAIKLARQAELAGIVNCGEDEFAQELAQVKI